MNDELGTMCVDWELRIDFDRLRRERVQKAQAAIAASEADLLFVFRTEDARYLTAYRHHLGPAAVIGNATVVVGADVPPILFTMDEAHCKMRMPWLGTGQVQPRANFREIAGIKEFADRLHGIMGSLSGKTIGIDMYTPAMAEGLRQAFPESRFVDGYEILIQAKIIKTDDEIHCLKIANSMTEAAMDAALAVLKPGVRECEVLAAAWQRMTAMGSEWTQCSNIVASGPYTAPYRRFTSDRIIRLGDPVIIDIGAVFNGYYGDFTRTWICGDIAPTKEQIALHQACYDSLHRAVGATLPGKTNADVVAACGEQFVLSSLGHGSGLNPWEPPHFSVTSKNDPLTLRPGMVANYEPYYGKPGVAGFRLEHNLVIREDGPEVYTTYPFDARLLTDVHPLDPSTGRVLRRG